MTVAPNDATDWIEAYVYDAIGQPGAKPKIGGLAADDASSTRVSQRFTLRVHYELKDGWQLVSPDPGQGTSYEWSYTAPTGGDVLDVSGNTGDGRQSFDVKVTDPAIYKVECKLPLKRTIRGKEQRGFMTIKKKGSFAAIGGALQLGIEETPIAMPRTWKHLEGDQTKAFYMQHWTSGWQKPQKGTLEVEKSQPVGTQVEWHLPDGLAWEDYPTSNVVAPTREFDTSPVRATFSLTYTDVGGGDVTGSVDDETTKIKDSVNGSLRMVNLFTARSPKTVDLDRSFPWDPKLTGHTNYDYRCGRRDVFVLKDGFGTPMPGVTVQERFTPVPFDLTINDNGVSWQTLLTNPPTGDPERDSVYPGCLDKYDWIGRWEPNPFLKTYTHTFYAATRSTVKDAVGVAVGTYKITFDSSSVSGASQTRVTN